jgi:hypothetical protein
LGFSSEAAMSSVKLPQGTEPETLQSTRQMLDELDALMDRMLALPVNDLDDSAPPPPDIVRMPTVSATLTVLEAPAVEAPVVEVPVLEVPVLKAPVVETPVPEMMEEKMEEKILRKPATARDRSSFLQESFPNYTTEFESDSMGSDEFLFRPKAKGPKTDVEPTLENEIPPSITKLAATAAKPKPAARSKPAPTKSSGVPILLPVRWFNQAFDLATLLLGAPGAWLRGPGGRRALGWTGFALIAAAGLWLAKDLLAWTW